MVAQTPNPLLLSEMYHGTPLLPTALLLWPLGYVATDREREKQVLQEFPGLPPQSSIRTQHMKH